MDEMYFYLLRTSESNDSGKYQYAQHLQSASLGDSGPSMTYWAEYAKRSTSYKEACKFLIFVKKFDNFVNQFDWEIVKYKMASEQLSWACQPKEMKKYENLLEGCSDLTHLLTIEEQKEIQNYEKELMKKYENKDR